METATEPQSSQMDSVFANKRKKRDGHGKSREKTHVLKQVSLAAYYKYVMSLVGAYTTTSMVLSVILVSMKTIHPFSASDRYSVVDQFSSPLTSILLFKSIVI